mmetsp:Transcript_6541/g.16919  ORF Transcript_6541/g.16919 Transcript_6541/m.16919 type:complete len:380 (-) Transcript_6541:261-1400(-)|eukprot:CAMPEP_0115870472 /NCGR_PEP_ID=MMETSP0287-20121206/22344_1 /TAXON_ID=412157 /ORGANISM="Chrysochromulina rotalis, Strain UIO044" /LENGTH=379 /DNA_ID=CAMNT_0003325195 /DNA_START=165 /DNA_END=1304 /DNA_ORIENTATION=-
MAGRQQPLVGSLFSSARIVPPAVTHNSSHATDGEASHVPCGIAEQHLHSTLTLAVEDELLEDEAITRIEAMEVARQMAEEKARLDEQEWHDEELRLHEEENWRRQARAAREQEERQHEAAALEAERIALGLSADGDDIEASASFSSGPTCFADLLALEGNSNCFDCDASLTDEDGDEASGGTVSNLWWSLTHGTILCEACAQIHRTLDASTSAVRPADMVTPAAEEPELDMVYAGGNEAFAAFLAEEGVGVSRRVWLALPLAVRYETPAAELYRRRLCALVDGNSSLPTDLRKPEAAPTTASPAEASPSPPPPQVHQAGTSISLNQSARWAPPDNREAYEEHTPMTDYLTAMAQMRQRIDAAKAASVGQGAPAQGPGSR